MTSTISDDASVAIYVDSVADAVVDAAGQDTPEARVLVFMDQAYDVGRERSSDLALTITRRLFDLQVVDGRLMEVLWRYKSEDWSAAVFVTREGFPYFEQERAYFTHNLAHELEHGRYFSVDPAGYHLGTFLKDSHYFDNVLLGEQIAPWDFPDEAECERVGKAAAIAIHGKEIFEETLRGLIAKAESRGDTTESRRGLLALDATASPVPPRARLLEFIKARSGLRDRLIARWNALYADDHRRSLALIANELPGLLTQDGTTGDQLRA